MGQDTNIVYACLESGRGVYIKYMHTYYLCLCKTYVNICICRYTHTRNIDVHKKVLYVLTNTNTDGACPGHWGFDDIQWSPRKNQVGGPTKVYACGECGVAWLIVFQSWLAEKMDVLTCRLMTCTKHMNKAKLFLAFFAGRIGMTWHEFLKEMVYKCV